ncbi:TetR/AcrR family transcriptional regulator C-terminal domain-containing protein [Sciscionella marina]|uniref:TetR/AcrR family transcriptional regulator C-terminal domain-containing protein n=1 Tax=Sciscionella marina TaxID=508770 RepID=UPI0003A89232|nr:TetR/AcrR family transcriptional regulator C-terminal domain-containing protein [Sciscionella marina]
MALGREQVVDAALELLDEIGLDALTTRRLAQRLNVHVGSIYWQVPSKQALLEAMADRIGARIREHPIEAKQWPEQVAEFARVTREALLAYRDGARIVVTALPTEALLEGANRLTGLLREAGASARLAALATDTIMSHVTGFTLQEQSQDEGKGSTDKPATREHISETEAVFAVTEKFALEVSLIIDGLRAAMARAPVAEAARADASE